MSQTETETERENQSLEIRKSGKMADTDKIERPFKIEDLQWIKNLFKEYQDSFMVC